MYVHYWDSLVGCFLFVQFLDFFFFRCIIQTLNCGNKQVTPSRNRACSISGTSKRHYQFLKSISELLTSPRVSNEIWINFFISKIGPGESPSMH